MGASDSIMVGGHLLSGMLQGAEYRVTRLGGWWDRPNIKRTVLARELADGDFPQPWHFEARYISIDGYVDCQDHAQMHHVMDQLNGIAVTRREHLTVQGHGQMQSALVEADGGALVEPVTDRLLRFELRFKANDPRKYGQSYTETVQGNYVTLHQHGNYPYYPIINVQAVTARQGFSLRANSPRDTITWRYGPLGAWMGTDYRIDMRTGRFWADDEERPDLVREARTWAIRPHEPTRIRITPNGEGTVEADVHWRDTWI